MGQTCNNSGVSRRTVLIAAAGAAPLLALMSSDAEAKMAQAAVKYQPDPKDGKQCDGCNFFVAPNSCKMVDGNIAATGWCALWVKKAAA
ncbi:MAG TPA: high-potential iron-sulfur protein [Roseiarcus sp.]|nr:high-potential iron-sulfur protein [Roseiarcus sp.]